MGIMIRFTTFPSARTSSPPLLAAFLPLAPEFGFACALLPPLLLTFFGSLTAAPPTSKDPQAPNTSAQTFFTPVPTLADSTSAAVSQTAPLRGVGLVSDAENGFASAVDGVAEEGERTRW